MSRNALFPLWAALILLGCQQQREGSPVATPTPLIETSLLPTVATAAEATAPSTYPPPPDITAVSTVIAAEAVQVTVLASPTKAKRVLLAIPQQWQELVNRVVEVAQSANPGNEWEIIVSETPAQLLEKGATGVALTQGEDGAVVSRDPIALAVPWATDWENVGGERAREIVQLGHPLVTVVAWRQMPPALKALRIDGRLPFDSGYPLNESWSLISTPGFETEVSLLATHFQRELEPPPMVQLAAVGDIMLDRSLGNALRQGKLAYPFSAVLDPLLMADVTVGNMESALGDAGQPAMKHYTFRAPPEAAAALAQAGFDIVSLANNHAMDYGPEALLQGITLLREQGVAPVGAGASAQEAYAAHLLEIHGLSIAFLGYVNVPVEVGGFDTWSWAAAPRAPGLAWASIEAINKGVSSARSVADIVIVLLHSGFEYIEEPGEAQVAAAHAAVEAGADLVIGHHTHVLQGIEFYGDGVIAYGLGNFAFEIEGPPESAILNAWLDSTGVRQFELIPITVQFGGQPRLAEAAEAGRIRQQVYYLTSLLNAP